MPVLLTDATYAYIYGTSSTPLAQVNLTDQTTLYLHGDLIGSIRSVTNAAGDVVCDADYDTYGQPAAVPTDPCGQATSSVRRPVHRPHRTHLPAGRYYDPASGQFLTVDPLVDTTPTPTGTPGEPPAIWRPTRVDFWQDAGDWAAGFGDTVTFGGTRWVRQKLGVDDVVNYCAGTYAWGGHVGTGAQVALAFGTGGLSAAYDLVGSGVSAHDSYVAFSEGNVLGGVLAAAGAVCPACHEHPAKPSTPLAQLSAAKREPPAQPQKPVPPCSEHRGSAPGSPSLTAAWTRRGFRGRPERLRRR